MKGGTATLDGLVIDADPFDGKPLDEPTYTTGGGGGLRTSAAVTNFNANKGTAGQSITSAVSRTQHATPTLVKPPKAKNDYWWIAALVALLIYFEWRK